MHAVRLRLRPAVLVPALATGALLALSPSAAAAGACASSSSFDAETARSIRLELRCLMNAERVRRGLRRLRPNGALARAARGHAQDMVARRYVSHYSKAGRGPASRVAGTGYLRGTRGWTVGENIAWLGQGRDPRAILSAWMGGAAHRQILLSPRFDELGIGVATSSPGGDERGLTVVVDFGHRSLTPRLRKVALFRKRP
jgi:uncharacterized protein YkwD